ncbi:MAG: glycyl-radical enzyme activating protein [Acidobacteriota bacterium]|jgi:pyruvate formate lyase activating enzyme|nr:glycyl-radical enzyme activating protein [Acidobacteriota bacterium]
MKLSGEAIAAAVTNIQEFSLHDGPGIRTVVFFKGCPLACDWCANPECISGAPQIGFMQALCARCGRCFDACPRGAVRREENVHRIDYSRCLTCGGCASRCGHGALVRYGDMMTVGEVLDAVRRDRMFYDSSRGGVTVSGGEPLLKTEFVRDLFTRCKEDGINTCIETCGFADWESLCEILPVTDHFLFDLKHMDAAAHEKHTGQSNERILANAALLMESGADVVFRQPLIPGVNDSPENIAATAGFLIGASNKGLELMPYHRMGLGKYRALDMKYHLDGINPCNDETAESVRAAYEAKGIRCTISR